MFYRVSHLRKRQGIQYYEVEWEADGQVATLRKYTDWHVHVCKAASLHKNYANYVPSMQAKISACVYMYMCTLGCLSGTLQYILFFLIFLSFLCSD